MNVKINWYRDNLGFVSFKVPFRKSKFVRWPWISIKTYLKLLDKCNAVDNAYWKQTAFQACSRKPKVNETNEQQKHTIQS